MVKEISVFGVFLFYASPVSTAVTDALKILTIFLSYTLLNRTYYCAKRQVVVIHCYSKHV